MNAYLQKVLFVFASIFAISNLGWIFTVFYAMSGSPEQIRVFAVQDTLVGLGCLAVCLVIASCLAHPVHEGLKKIEQGSISEAELLFITRRNVVLPYQLCLLTVVMIPVSSAIIYFLYMAYDIGATGPSGLWAHTVVGVFALTICLYGGLTFITSPVANIMYREFQVRSIPYTQRDFRLSTKITILFVNICLGLTVWTGILGFYEGLHRLKEEVKVDMVAFGRNMAAEILADKGAVSAADDIRPYIDRAGSSGMGRFFLMSPDGSMLYNPAGVDPFTRTWEDIDASFREAIRGDTPRAFFENVHERFLCFVPLGGGVVIGMSTDLASRIGGLNRFFLMAGLFFLIAIGVVAVTLFSLLMIVVFPVRKTVEKLEELSTGEGDLTARLVVHSSDEMGELASRFNTFLSKLEEIITQVKSAALDVDTSSQEVSSSTRGLTGSVQEQARAFELMADTIEMMTTSIKSNAAAAEQGLKKTRAMVSMAGSSEESLNSLVSAMDEVSLASKRIGDIISTVNEVAFQTNLLALNAAVEAARAGEHGKGFAVVADEVRALAQRSSEASREIRKLIEDTVEKIRTSDSVAKSTGNAMQDIIREIDDISRTIEEFAAAAVEQTGGVDNLNRAVLAINTTSRKNTQTLDVLGQSAGQMLSAADRLTGGVGRFRVSRDLNGQQALPGRTVSVPAGGGGPSQRLKDRPHRER
ncbi:MAG TPA: methyl-accepting chemotaxis protein [Deltaproteobacteria bacterium]|nr:methyl-accepting chemotaxis protein [Deltaproteobacteria bacterium]HOI05557.1 methyl-accepting chemotaxis protein [Deltaproteobacteria bacterium]